MSIPTRRRVTQHTSYCSERYLSRVGAHRALLPASSVCTLRGRAVLAELLALCDVVFESAVRVRGGCR